MNSPLISPEELLARLNDANLVILDARPEAAGYAEGHLTGAQRADLETQLSAAREVGANPAHGGRHPLPSIERFAQQLGSWGITPQTFVVIYDDQSGANAAARAWWMLRAVGHERVAVLDGGLSAAIAAGLPTTVDAPAVETVPPYPTPVIATREPQAGQGTGDPREASLPAKGWRWPTVDRQRVDDLRSDPDWRVLDVRSAERFRGDTEPIDPIAGHIPGALNLFFGNNLQNGRYKAPAELREQYRELLGNTPPDKLVVHCGSGVTACHTLLALDAAGLSGAALYVGSWSEWCRNDLPRAGGED